MKLLDISQLSQKVSQLSRIHQKCRPFPKSGRFWAVQFSFETFERRFFADASEIPAILHRHSRSSVHKKDSIWICPTFQGLFEILEAFPLLPFYGLFKILSNFYGLLRVIFFFCSSVSSSCRILQCNNCNSLHDNSKERSIFPFRISWCRWGLMKQDTSRGFSMAPQEPSWFRLHLVSFLPLSRSWNDAETMLERC